MKWQERDRHTPYRQKKKTDVEKSVFRILIKVRPRTGHHIAESAPLYLKDLTGCNARTKCSCKDTPFDSDKTLHLIPTNIRSKCFSERSRGIFCSRDALSGDSLYLKRKPGLFRWHPGQVRAGSCIRPDASRKRVSLTIRKTSDMDRKLHI